MRHRKTREPSSAILLDFGDSVVVRVERSPSHEEAQEIYRALRAVVGYRCSMAVEVETRGRQPDRRHGLRLVK